MAVVELQRETLLTVKEESQFVVVMRRFLRHRLAILALIVIAVFIFIAVFAHVIAPYDPYKQNLAPSYSGPSPEHILGVDELGRDIFSRLIYAARLSLFVTLVVNFTSETIGMFIGAISGYFRGWVDSVIQRTVEFMLTLPTLPLLLFFSSLLRGITVPGLPDEWSKAIVISGVLIAFGWMGSTRLVRGMVLSLREQEFAQAARALGMGDWGIIVRHMIPNSLAPVIVNLTLGLGTVIVLEAALSFLGFGITPPVPTWGNMLQNVQERMWQQPWLAFYPGLCIFLVSISFNYVGDGLRDALDPRLKL
ncbi:MAG TPA: ABC transporter permease [Anaerolineales bacterium]|nr:ABC transporter permease [Anaerolineales bacterium]